MCAILSIGGGAATSARRNSVNPRAPMREAEKIVFHEPRIRHRAACEAAR